MRCRSRSHLRHMCGATVEQMPHKIHVSTLNPSWKVTHPLRRQPPISPPGPLPPWENKIKCGKSSIYCITYHADVVCESSHLLLIWGGLFICKHMPAQESIFERDVMHDVHCQYEAAVGHEVKCV